MKALFGRKILNLKELKEFTNKAKEAGERGICYKVVKEIILNDEKFNEFTKALWKNQTWISEGDGGCNDKEELKCIRVKNIKTKKSILVDPEGYTYPRYTALED